VMFLDFAEDQAQRRKQIFLRDWQTRLDDFLRFNERPILPNAGGVTREEANRRAHEEYTRFEQRRRVEAENAGERDALRRLEEAARVAERSKPAAPDRKRRQN